MSIEVDVLSEAYVTLKQYIPQKDRQEAADNLMGLLVDMLDDSDLKVLSGTDSALGRAYKEYASEFEEEFDDDDDGYSD